MKRLFWTLAVLVLTAAFAHAAGNSTGDSVKGVVTRICPGMIYVSTDFGDTTQVAVDSDTQYTKWLITKSFAQDPHVDLAYMRIGDRVRIKLRQNEPEAVARKVYVIDWLDHPEG